MRIPQQTISVLYIFIIFIEWVRADALWLVPVTNFTLLWQDFRNPECQFGSFWRPDLSPIDIGNPCSVYFISFRYTDAADAQVTAFFDRRFCSVISL